MPAQRWSKAARVGALQFGMSFREAGETKDVSTQLLTELGKRFLAGVDVAATRVVLAGLTHGRAVAEVGEDALGQTIFAHDGLLTRSTNVCLAVTISDCFAIVLYDQDASWLSVLHAGWRGAASHIIHEACEQKRMFDDRLDSLRAWISPGIQRCHFDVGADVAALFAYREEREGLVYVDLQATLVAQLQDEGVSSILVDDRCTACDPGLFFSYRRDQPPLPQTMLAYAVMR